MTPLKHLTPNRTQSGFTLLELLFAMTIILVVVVAVQRYVAGVLTDAERLSAQQDQTNQINIVLSNIQNDVARAGFIPVASAEWTEEQLTTELKNVGVDVRCVDAKCDSKELWTSYWTLENPAYDCVHNQVSAARTSNKSTSTAQTSDWVRVENVYRFEKRKGVWVLGCDGNGGNNGGNWEGFTNPTAGDIEDFDWRLNRAVDGSGKRMLHLCMNIRTAKNNQVSGNIQPALSCTTGLELAASDVWAYQTIQLDMLVRPSQIGVVP